MDWRAYIQIYQDQGDNEQNAVITSGCIAFSSFVYSQLCMKQNCKGVTATIQMVAVITVVLTYLSITYPLKVTGESFNKWYCLHQRSMAARWSRLLSELPILWYGLRLQCLLLATILTGTMHQFNNHYHFICLRFAICCIQVPWARLWDYHSITLWPEEQ